MDTLQIQEHLFQTVKRKLAAEASLAEELATLLKISTDSAYRRIRGEKIITLDELYTIASHYRISLDQLMNIDTGGFQFSGNLLNSKTFRYDAYLTGMMHNLAYFNSFKEKHIFYLCKDTPIFHYFNSDDLAAFKYYFWMGNLVYFPEFRGRKVSFDEYPEELRVLGKKIIGLYGQIDSSEVWNMES